MKFNLLKKKKPIKRRRRRTVPTPTLKLHMGKDILTGYLRDFVFQSLHKSGHTLIVIFDKDNIPLTKGNLTYAETSMYNNGKASIVFYMDNITRAFLVLNKNKYPPLNKDNIKKFKDMVDPIITEQIFSLSGPLIKSTNGKVNWRVPLSYIRPS